MNNLNNKPHLNSFIGNQLFSKSLPEELKQFIYWQKDGRGGVGQSCLLRQIIPQSWEWPLNGFLPYPQEAHF